MALRPIFRDALEEDWDGFTSSLQSLDEEALEEPFGEGAPEPFTGESSILHVVCNFPSVKSFVVQEILKKSPRLAESLDGFGQNPLHIAVTCCCRSDIVGPLVRTAPQSAHQQDFGLLRPIDLLCQSIIMKEERSKYATKNNNNHHHHGATAEKDANETVDDVQCQLWECVQLLACALIVSSNDNHEIRDWELPTLHACLRATPFDFPFSLLDRAMKRYEHQFQVQDGRGDLPLHIVAAWSPDEDITDNFLQDVAKKYIKGAKIVNREDKLPLQLAIENHERSWTTGIGFLMSVYPAPDRFGMPLSTLILGKVAARGYRTVVFEMLRNQPALFTYR